MRVLWLSPWMRPLARVHAEALVARGHQVLVVTADQHPEPDDVRAYELVLSGQRKDPRSWLPLPAARRRIAGFAPDVVVGELVRDPRWAALATGLPRITVVHDDRPHDAGEQRPRWERAVFDRWAGRSSITVAFSEYVAGQLRARGHDAVTVLPLTSDLEQRFVPPLVPAEARRDIVALGRVRPYKNLAVTFEAWRRHVAGPHWRGDDLVVLGEGALPGPLPPHARHLAGAYRYRDVVPTLARAKASLVHYRRASQSGVQVLSMQLGVTPIVSPCGALLEYQPAGESAIEVDDAAGLAGALDALADPEVAVRRGSAARTHYAAGLDAGVTSAAWERVLSAARQRARSTR